MALDRLFREVIDPALKEYRKGKSYLDEVEQQARDNIHEIYYTNRQHSFSSSGLRRLIRESST